MKPTYKLLGLTAILATSVAVAQDPIVGGQIHISIDPLCNAGNETSAVTSSNMLESIGGFNDWRTDGTIKASFGVSSDGGNTWAHVLVRPPAANQTSVEGDPMACYDKRTNTIFAGAISFAGNGGLYIAKKNPGVNSFQPSTMARVDGGVDKGWMACGPIPGNPNTSRLYIAFNEGVIWSDNLGATFTSSPKSLGVGLGLLPRIGPSGELYVCFWDDNFGVKCAHSYDGGATFSIVTAATRMDSWGTETGNGRVPGDYRIPPINTMAVNPVNGTITIMYFDTTNTIGSNRNIDLYMTQSTNKGLSFSTPVRLPFRALSTVGDMFFPWIEYTSDGRMHLQAFNTVYTSQNDGGAHGFLDLDYAYSDDDGATWSSRFRMTPASFDSHNDGRNAGTAFMGDYLGIGISDHLAVPVYGDTHTGQLEIYTNKVYNPISRPETLSFFRGNQTGGTLASLFLHDNSKLTAQPSIAVNSGEPPVQMEISATSPLLSPSSLKMYLWTSVNSINIQQGVQLFNVNTQHWDVVDTRAISSTESNYVITVPSPTNYIAAGGQVKARITDISNGPVSQFPWTVTTNEAVFLIAP